MESRVWFNDIDMLFADRNKIRYTCWTSSREFSRYMNSTRQPVLTVQTDTGDFILEPEGTGFSEQISYFQTVDPSFE
ncbi:MAG: hypothetical protein PQJ50_10650 [Spirochaetales bacterium]|nr:hypothetical protein [Spirochaetales bacterium]